MAQQHQKLWEILVPAHSNDGLEYSVDYHHTWDGLVRALAGGITFFRSAKGQWVGHGGQGYHDKMIPVRVCCDEQTIDEILSLTLNYYGQEAVFAYEVSANVKVRTRA